MEKKVYWPAVWALVIGIVVLYFVAGNAKADGGFVHVDPLIPHSQEIKTRLESKLLPKDQINITLLDGDEVIIVADGWPEDDWIDQRIKVAKTVTETPEDQIVLVVRQIHRWQDLNPKPEPPKPPEPPKDWGPFWKGVGIIAGASTVVSILVTLLVKRHKKRKGLLTRANAQADWTVEDYLKENQ